MKCRMTNFRRVLVDCEYWHTKTGERYFNFEDQSKASLEMVFRATWCRREGNASKKNAVNNYEAAAVRNCALRACSEKSYYV
jgi:hypothetical protein